jgi:RNA polymerase sigma-B factor
MTALAPSTMETEQLFVLWREHRDERARDELVARHLPLARKLAGRYRGGSEPFDDLLQVASLGLLKAIDRFDPSRGTAFSSFAVPTILGEVKRYFRDTGWAVHIARGAQELALRVQEAERELSAQTGRSPTVPQLAQFLEVSVEQVMEGLEAAGAHHAGSLDAPHDELDSESRTLLESLGAEDQRFELLEENLTIASAAELLSAQEREVLCLRFEAGLTQGQIAARIGVSQMQVSRILRRTLARMQELIASP